MMVTAAATANSFPIVIGKLFDIRYLPDIFLGIYAGGFLYSDRISFGIYTGVFWYILPSEYFLVSLMVVFHIYSLTKSILPGISLYLYLFPYTWNWHLNCKDETLEVSKLQRCFSQTI
jgi:hypothetical protein